MTEGATSLPSERQEAPSLLARLRQKLLVSLNDAAAVRAKFEEDVRKAEILYSQLRRLIADAQKAKEKFARAEDQFTSRSAELKTLDDLILNGWGHEDIPNGPVYGQLLALRACVQDFPRARALLEGKVRQAEQAVITFQKKHGLWDKDRDFNATS